MVCLSILCYSARRKCDMHVVVCVIKHAYLASSFNYKIGVFVHYKT